MKDIIIILILFAAVIFTVPLFLGKSTDGGTNSGEISEPPVFPDKLNLYLAGTNEIVTVTADEYLTGCLCAQIPINYEPEALKAQACASATYALKLMKTLNESDKLPPGADISDDSTLCQPYFTEEKRREEYGADYDKYIGNIEAAARFGKYHIITYENEPVWAVYHSVSAGKTCPSEYIWGTQLDYLRSADSGSDTGYINFECRNEMREEEARAALIRYDPDIEIPADCGKWFTEMNANEQGYVISAKIGKKEFSGGDLWRIFGLRSTSFTVTYLDGIFTFTTKGYGHGAGLSQYGAESMAQSGFEAEQILHHYYGDTVEIT